MLSHDATTRVADEMARGTTDGTTETVVMRLDLESTADNAALVPTPTPAKVGSASETLFDELQELSASRVETVRDWRFGPGTSPPEGVAATPGSLPYWTRCIWGRWRRPRSRAPFQRVVYRHETYDITIPVLGGAAAAVFLAVLAAAVVVVRRRSA
ncbi:hypothetical protein ACVWWN_007938 [Mycobacterium sp. URHB0021]